MDDSSLYHAFREIALKNPDRVAIVEAAPQQQSLEHSNSEAEDVPYTYAQLLTAVDLVATHILNGSKGTPNSSGVSIEDKAGLEKIWYGVEGSVNCQRVGILIARSAEYIVAVLAVLKLGAVFVPFDPSWPKKRIAAVAKDSKPCLLIICSHALSYSGESYDWKALTGLFPTPILCLPERFIREWSHRSERSGVFCFGHTEKESPYCYIMYTSGSTGPPKGVCGTEEGLMHRLCWMQSEFPYVLSDVTLFKTPIGFIDHLTECFGPLLGMSTLIIPCLKDSLIDPLLLLHYLKAYRITRLTAVPSLMRILLPFLQTPDGKEAVKSMHVLVLSGEKLTFSLWKALYGVMPDTTILNLYGSTELSGDCLYFDCRKLSEEITILSEVRQLGVPIGKQIPGCNIWILPATENLGLTAGEGELYISGPVLAVGYFNNTLYTNQKFVLTSDLGSAHSDNDALIFSATASSAKRVFKTGDYVRRMHNGDCIFLRRIDRTVKVNGQRVALEEVESCLEEHPKVAGAAVIYHVVDHSPYLVACIVPEMTVAYSKCSANSMTSDQRKALPDTLNIWLSKRLPSFMVPNRFLLFKTFPTTISGKVDYDSLRSMSFLKLNMKRGRCSEQEWTIFIQEVFKDALKINNISPVDDFFSLGGTSISAAHVAFVLGIDMQLLYTHRSPVSLATAVKGKMEKTYKKRSFEKDEIQTSKALKTLELREVGSVFLSVPLEDVEVQPLLEDKCSSLSLQKLKYRHVELTQKSNKICMYNSVHNANGSVLQYRKYNHASGWPFANCSSDAVALTRCNRFINSEQSVKICSLISASSVNSSLRLSVLWKTSLNACVDASPVLVKSMDRWHLYIGSHAQNFVCLDALSGWQKWEAVLRGRVESTAAVTQNLNQVVFGCYDNSIYFIDSKSGKVLWSFQTREEVKCQPTLDIHTGFIWCGSHDHNIYVLDTLQQSLVWEHDCGGSIFGAVAHDTERCMAYVATTNGTITAIVSKAPFRVAWIHTCGSPLFGSPMVDIATGNVICTLVAGAVIALKFDSKLIWEVTTNGPIFAGACMSSAIPDQVLICSRDGWIYSFRITDGQCLWKHLVGEPIVSSAYVEEGFEVVHEEQAENYTCLHKFRFVCVSGTSGSLVVLKVYSGSRVSSNVCGTTNKQSDISISMPINSKGTVFKGPNKSQDNKNKHVSAAAQASTWEGFLPTNIFPMCQSVAELKLPGDVFSSPVMFCGRIFLGCRDNNVYCIQLIGLEENVT